MNTFALFMLTIGDSSLDCIIRSSAFYSWFCMRHVMMMKVCSLVGGSKRRALYRPVLVPGHGACLLMPIVESARSLPDLLAMKVLNQRICVDRSFMNGCCVTIFGFHKHFQAFTQGNMTHGSTHLMDKVVLTTLVSLMMLLRTTSIHGLVRMLTCPLCVKIMQLFAPMYGLL
jgi:hypothetical protein